MNITQKKEIVDNILELLIQLTEDGENTVPQTTAAPTSNKSRCSQSRNAPRSFRDFRSIPSVSL